MGAIYQFGEFRLDCGRFALLRDGCSLALERKPMELLILLAERNGQLVSRSEIGERLWDREVFVDTEHGINTAVRKIRHVLRDDSDAPRFIQTVTGKGYRFAAEVVVEGLIAAPLMAPAPYVAGSGHGSSAVAESEAALPQQAAPVAGDAEARKARLRWGAAALLATAIVVAAGLAWLRFGLHPAAARGISSLAVLPLDNVSGDAAQEYLADGMTDELTTMLVRESTLRVVSRTSVMQYKRAHRPISQIARALGVDPIVEGSVARAGDHVHLNLQLIRADTDTHLWAESYDRDANDGTLPQQAAQTIANRLHSATETNVPVRYVNPAAHDAYLRGRYLWFADRMEDSGAYFRKATEIEPDYAAAWAGLSAYYGQGISAGVLDPRTSMGPAEAAARRALSLDPNLAEAHQAMGGVFLIVHWDGLSADREMLRAIDLNPQEAELYYLRSCALQLLRRIPESIELAKKAMELNPFERPYGLASIYLGARQYDAALAELQLRLQATPNNPDLLFFAADAWRRKGNYHQAVPAWAKYYEAIADPQAAVELQRAYDRGGAHGFVRWLLARRLKQARSKYVSPMELATYHAQLGETEQTLSLLEEGYRQHSTDFLWFPFDPAFDFLHNDPRYQALVAKIGVPDDARQAK